MIPNIKMKSSIGIDIVDVKDFEKRIKRAKNLAQRLFTKHELEYCKNRGIEHLASRFAAKEAFAKASKLKELSWKDIEVRNEKSGRPYLDIKKEIMKKIKIKFADLSISNIKDIAVAVVVITH